MKAKIGDTRFVLIAMAVVAVLFTVPIYQNFGHWGQFDWDQHFFYNAVPHRTVLEFHQFPLWNPYYCGGNPMLANPQSMFLSPSFVLVLLFGVVVGLKLSITLYLGLGLFGMFLLARHLRMSVGASYLTSFVFMLSSWFSLRMLAGHLTYFTVAWIPFLFLFYLKSIRNRKYILVSAGFMAVIFFGGGVYPFYFTVLMLGFFAALQALRSRKNVWLVNFGILLVGGVLFGAIKVLPTAAFLNGLDLPPGDPQYYGIELFPQSFLSREQNPLVIDQDLHTQEMQDIEAFVERTESGVLRWSWHEYGAYLGLLPLLLVLVSLSMWRKVWPFAVTAFLLLFVVLGNLFPLGLWQLFKNIPFLSVLHGPSRFAVPLVFMLALLAGLGLDVARRRGFRFSWVIVSIVLVDLFFVSLPVYGSIFVVEPLRIEKTGEFFHIVSSDPGNRQYSNFLENLGTANCYERVRLPVKAIARVVDTGNPINQYRGEAYFAEGGSAQISEFTPNTMSAVHDRAGTLVFNVNYDSGWRSKAELASYEGVVAANVHEAGKVRIRYLPTSFVVGLLITLASAGAAIVLWKKKFIG